MHSQIDCKLSKKQMFAATGGPVKTAKCLQSLQLAVGYLFYGHYDIEHDQ